MSTKVIRRQSSPKFDGKFLFHAVLDSQDEAEYLLLLEGNTEASPHIQLNFSRHNKDIKQIHRIYVKGSKI